MIQVINRAIDILEYVAKEPESPKPLGEVATALSLNAGTCANIIKTLVERKYLDKHPNQKGYTLGSMAYNLTGNDGYKKDLIEAARNELETLTKKLNENSLLTILKENNRITVLSAQGNNEIRSSSVNEWCRIRRV